MLWEAFFPIAGSSSTSCRQLFNHVVLVVHDCNRDDSIYPQQSVLKRESAKNPRSAATPSSSGDDEEDDDDDIEESSNEPSRSSLYDDHSHSEGDEDPSGGDPNQLSYFLRECTDKSDYWPCGLILYKMVYGVHAHPVEDLACKETGKSQKELIEDDYAVHLLNMRDVNAADWGTSIYTVWSYVVEINISGSSSLFTLLSDGSSLLVLVIS